MSGSSGVFTTLPENFFSPLAGQNREHYAALLILFYRLFQENTRGLLREEVMNVFSDYAGRHRESLLAEASEEDGDGSAAADTGNPPEPEFDFGESGGPSPDFDTSEPDAAGADNPSGDPGLGGATAAAVSDRTIASRFLRRLMSAGWLGEETLPDYSRIINITPHARPFFEALARVEEGLKTEYESHVVAIYSLLCTDAVSDNGHYAVLNAHSTTTALMDSLKVLSQSIKLHYDRFSARAADGGIKDLLHLHYDLYANDILDGAYKRLKTSDNLSRYRPRIIKQVGELLGNETWLAESSRKLSRIASVSAVEGRSRLETMLEEIRDTLRAMDPLIEDIDRRNMLYSRASIERIKTLLEPDSTVAGKLGTLVRRIYTSRSHSKLQHRLHLVRTFGPGSLYRRYRRDAIRPETYQASAADREALKQAEEELRLRLERQLSPGKISGWLDDEGGREKSLASKDLVRDEDSFVRFLYSLLYADSRRGFTYFIEDNHKTPLETADYTVPDVVFRRKA